MITKKGLLFLACLLSVQAALLKAQVIEYDDSSIVRSPVFSDTFSDNKNNWITDNSWISGGISNGMYEITCKNFRNSTGLTYQSLLPEPGTDFEVETSFRINKGTGALVFGLTEDFEHVRIEVDDRKNLVMVRDLPSKGRVEKLFSVNVSQVINGSQYNKLTVRRIENRYYVFINDQFIKEIDKIVLSGNNLGYSVGLNSNISIDYLNVSGITQQTPPAPAIAQAIRVEKDTISSREVVLSDTAVLAVKDSVLIPPDQVIPPPIPSITWVSPSGLSTELDTYTARVRSRIQSPSELNSVLFYVNGASTGAGELKQSADEPGVWIAEKSINMNPGDNNVYIIATNAAGSTKSDLRYFKNPQASLPEIKWGVPVASNGIVNSELFTLELCIKSLANCFRPKFSWMVTR